MADIIILNFSHPHTAEHIAQIEKLTKQKVEQVLSIAVKFDSEKPFEHQLQELMSEITFSSNDLQTKPIIINLPSLNVIAALVLAEMHGRMGYFAPILRMKPVPGVIPPLFEVAELINLQNLRDFARKGR